MRNQIPAAARNAHAHLGRRLEMVRSALGLNQTQVARTISKRSPATPYNQSMWSAVERGKRRIEPLALLAFAQSYAITLEYLVRGETAQLQPSLRQALADNNPILTEDTMGKAAAGRGKR